MYLPSSSDRRNEPSGSHSKLRRKSRLIHTTFRSIRRVGNYVARDTSLLLLFFALSLFFHFRADIHGLLEKEFTQSTSTSKLDSNQDYSSGKTQDDGPPSYLPLAQHLKNINISDNKPSLSDMVYGVQRRTQPDLKSTNNKDLDKCVKCRGTTNMILQSTFLSKKHLKLARALLKLIAFYEITSMVTIPCSEEAHWVLPLVKATRVVYPDFEHHCVIAEDSLVVDMIKTYGPNGLQGTHFVTYKPHIQGHLPPVDMMFTWRGLEHYSLDDIHQIFRDTVSAGIMYTLIGNSPGLANARMVERSKGVFSIVRPEVPALNVRAFPFGFNKAERAIPVLEKQLLFYNSTEMRDTW